MTDAGAGAAARVFRRGGRMSRDCVVCGEPIPDKRLQALPDTRTCVGCSSATKKSIQDMPGTATVQHTGGLHEKYLKEEDL